MKEQKVKIQQTFGNINMDIETYHNGYLDKVLRSNSYEELMWLFLSARSPSKEITESRAAFSNLKKHCILSDHICYHIGDGGWARTAALFAFNCKSYNISIDPQLNQKGKLTEWMERYNVKNLEIVPKKWEDWDERKSFNGVDAKGVLVCVHSHVDIEAIFNKHGRNLNIKYIYSNPCCQVGKQTLSKKFMEENNIECLVDKDDFGIHSEQRRVLVYKVN